MIAGRKTVGEISGDLLFNGHARGPAFRKEIGYVEQFDTLMGTLTVYEMLYYTARLKLPADSDPEYAREKTLDLIKAFGLESCKDVKIGRPLERGISGGQAKRVNITLELIDRQASRPLSNLVSYMSSL